MAEAFELGYLGHGAKAMEFEARLGEYRGAAQVVGVGTGTAA